MSQCVKISLTSVLFPVRPSALLLQMNLSQSGSRSRVRTCLCSQVWRHFLWTLSTEPWPSAGSWAARHTQTPPSDPETCTHTPVVRDWEILKLRTLEFQIFDCCSPNRILLLPVFEVRLGVSEKSMLQWLSTAWLSCSILSILFTFHCGI